MTAATRYRSFAAALAVVTSVFLSPLAALANNPAEQADINNDVTDFCSSQRYLDLITAELQVWISSAVSKTKKHANEANLLRLAERKHATTGRGTAYAFLAALAQQRAAAAAQHAERIAKNAAAEIEQIARRTGEQAAYAMHVTENAEI
ncbi:uncharacterized protein TEOVI_000819500 [Trypanosoma equiperdum]|uniref:Trypanosome variant surface glycoprotein (A-type) n=1 Tax=Trypanosoma equiperdum TaxID=5694 RepID=A0A1G4I1M5_TRYEQ|nr:hypothetical protein TEOVI_000819500 [Trypanosoma equiperdum]